MGGTAAGRLGSGNTGGITGSATLGASGGQQSHTLTSAEQASMSVSLPFGATNGTGTGAGFTNTADNSSFPTATASGGGGAHNITPPALVLNYIIKY